MARPLILVSNDDGVRAPGIASMAQLAQEFGDVWVSAPDTEQSGAGHAITLRTHLRVQEVEAQRYGVSGSPADSVYVGALQLCPRRPSLVLAGINDGYNLGNDVYYSGTVAAAREGVLRGIPAIAASVERGGEPASLHAVLRHLIERVLAKPAEAGQLVFLNVNAPKLEAATNRFEVTRLGDRRYADRVERRSDLQNNAYYWIGGPPIEGVPEPGTDTTVVAGGGVSVTPLRLCHDHEDTAHWGTLLA